MKISAAILILAAWGASSRVGASKITLDTGMLPSAQGWEFSTKGMHAAVKENEMFSVNGNILTMNNLDQPLNWDGGSATYRLGNVIDGSKKATLEWTSRTTEYKKSYRGGHDNGFYVAFCNGKYRYLVGITKDRILLDHGLDSQTLEFDATEYHTYRIETTPGSAEYDFYIDNTRYVTLKGKPSSSNLLVFGDATSTANAKTNIKELTLEQQTDWSFLTPFAKQMYWLVGVVVVLLYLVSYVKLCVEVSGIKKRMLAEQKKCPNQ